MDYYSHVQPRRRDPTRVQVSAAPAVLRELVSQAGIAFDGDHPWDIRVNNPDLYRRVLSRGALGFGEAYVDGLWDAEQLDETFHRLLAAHIDRRLDKLTRLRLLGALLRNRLLNRQSHRHSCEVGERHYDVGNAVFQAMLDSTMSYSCGYWQEADTLEEAQRAKLALICRKLELGRRQRLLDIGCGWGGLACYAAREYGAEVLGITISKEQLVLARERCRYLPELVELMDYRELQSRFDKVVSVGMFEHVGPKNYPRFFRIVHRVLEDDGLFLLHTIGTHASSEKTDA